MNDNHMHPPTNLVKLPIFYGVSFEGSYIFQDDEALQLPLMAMSGACALDEVYEQFHTRVSTFESSRISVTPSKSLAFSE